MKKKINLNISINMVVFYAFFLYLNFWTCTRYGTIDNDLWIRLIQGQYVLKHHAPMFNDIFSYIPTHTWYDPEWLSSTFLYVIQNKFSLVGLSVLQTVSIFVAFICTIKTVKIRLHDKNITAENPIYFVFFYLAILVSGIYFFTIRCQLITFIMFPVWIYILEKIRKGNKKYIISLPIIMVVWLNSHAGCIAGIGMLTIYIIGEFLNKKSVKPYLLGLILSLIVFIINPWRENYYSFLFNSIFQDRSSISEWSSSFMLLAPMDYIFYKLLILVSISSYIFKIRKLKIPYISLNKTKIITIFALVIISLMHIKHITLCVIGLTIFCYEDILYTAKILFCKSNNLFKGHVLLNSLFSRYINCLICVFLTLILMLVQIKIPNNELFLNYIKGYPVKPVKFINDNNLKGNLFSIFDYNSYLIYKCYPNIKIFMDGRQEQVYTNDQLSQNIKLVNTPDKNITQKFWKITDIFLVENKQNLNKYLSKRDDFVKIYNDSKYSIFIKKENKKSDYIMPNLNDDEYDNIFKTKIKF